MKALFPELRAIAKHVVALQAKARALGLFANDRELLECTRCGLQEDVACSGLLLTSYPESLGVDTGLRFKELGAGRFRCPACGAAVREPEPDVPVGAQSTEAVKRRRRATKCRKRDRPRVAGRPRR
jgi:hypothetical protein